MSTGFPVNTAFYSPYARGIDISLGYVRHGNRYCLYIEFPKSKDYFRYKLVELVELGGARKCFVNAWHMQPDLETCRGQSFALSAHYKGVRLS